MKLKTALLITALNPTLYLSALTVGVFDVKGDVGNQGGPLADIAQSELAGDKTFTMRDRLSVQNMIANQEKCASAQKQCDIMGGQTKLLDVYVTGEAVSLPQQKKIVLKAVSANDQKITAVAVGDGDSLEKSMREAASELKKKISGSANADKGAAQKMRLAVQPVRGANAAAQKSPELSGLDSILLTALSQRASFDLVDVKSDDIIESERLLASYGFAPQASAPTGGDYTHYVAAIFNVYDECRSLSFSVISRKTNKAMLEDKVEWCGNEDPFARLDELAKNTEHELVSVLGRIEITACDPRDAMMSIETKDGSRPRDQRVCAGEILIEGVPAGEHTITFTHDERNTLVQAITVKPMETLKLGRVVLPDIDMSLFNQASGAEASGNYAQAISLYQQFYTKYPKHRMALYAMYREGYVTQLRLKRVADGRKILETLISGKPNAEIRSEAFVGVALGYKAEGDNEKANDQFRTIAREYAGTTAAEFARECLEGKCSY